MNPCRDLGNSLTCQNPGCWRESDPHANARDYANRRHTVRAPSPTPAAPAAAPAPSETPLATAPTCRKRCSPGGGPCTATNSSCSPRRPGPNGRTWLSICVDLVEAGGHHGLWPRPGWILAARSHTFQALATAIDDTFARWYRTHY